MELNEKIKTLRLQRGLTLEQVGQYVGVGKSTVRKWETGMIKNMKRDKIAKLAEVLHTTPAYLMGWEDELAPMTPEGQKKFDELNEIFGDAFSKLSLDKQILIQKIVQMDDETIAALNQIADQIIARR